MKDKRLLFAAGLPITLCLVALLAGFCGIRLNFATDSIPLGFYRIVNSATAKDIIFCPTGLAESVSIEREYRPKGFGCGDGYLPLIKPIVARAGDIVSVNDQGVTVNGRLLPKSKQIHVDGHGRSLPLVPHGTYTVASGTVWVISTFNGHSFDSRYFGPISLTGKTHYANPFWIF